ALCYFIVSQMQDALRWWGPSQRPATQRDPRVTIEPIPRTMIAVDDEDEDVITDEPTEAVAPGILAATPTPRATLTPAPTRTAGGTRVREASPSPSATPSAVRLTPTPRSTTGRQPPTSTVEPEP